MDDLSGFFPAHHDISAWDSARSPALNSSTTLGRAFEVDVGAMKIARDLGLPHILPSALLACALAPLSAILHGVTLHDGRRVELDASDKVLCIQARHEISLRLSETLRRWTTDAADSQGGWPTLCASLWCRTAPGVLAATLLAEDPERQSHFLARWVPGGRIFSEVESQFSPTCVYGCLSVCRQRYQALRGDVWLDVPSLFGFEDWTSVVASGAQAAWTAPSM
jgi:hypothetical protein